MNAGSRRHNQPLLLDVPLTAVIAGGIRRTCDSRHCGEYVARRLPSRRRPSVLDRVMRLRTNLGEFDV
jgi:hypothetical protein